ncbi:MAG TPA: chemotaxis protein CheW [Xanthobacteraceae bacterium]|nr:chemotaxis protein CheW [Xanthobacteraceae bacterium]
MTKWSGNTSLSVLTFGLGSQIFALEAASVREILDMVPVTVVPKADPFVNGLINVRGKVAPLADLRIKLGMELLPPTIDARIVVIEVDLAGDPTLVGIRADKVCEVIDLLPATLEEAPRIGMRWPAQFIRCIAKRGGDFVVVLDIARIFATDAGAGSPVEAMARAAGPVIITP